MAKGDVSAQLADFAADCRHAGEKDLPKLMRKGVRAAAKPLGEGMKRNASRKLPKSGGLAALIASSRISTKIKTSRRAASVSVEMKKPKAKGLVDLKSINRGRIRHPLFGDRGEWFNTETSPNLITGGLEPEIDQATREIEKVVGELASKLAAG